MFVIVYDVTCCHVLMRVDKCQFLGLKISVRNIRLFLQDNSFSTTMNAECSTLGGYYTIFLDYIYLKLD